MALNSVNVITATSLLIVDLQTALCLTTVLGTEFVPSPEFALVTVTLFSRAFLKKGGYSGGDCSQKTKSNSVLPIAIGASAGGVALVGAIVAGGFYTRKWRKNRKMRFTEPPYTQTVFGRYLDLHYDTKGRDLGYLTAFSSMLHRTGFELATSICQVASSTDREGVSRSLVHSLAAGDEDLIPLMTKLIDNEVEKAESKPKFPRNFSPF